MNIMNTVIFATLLVVAVMTYQVGAIGYCPSFCDTDGFYHDARQCHRRPHVYCCGSVFRRYCCSNSTQDISGFYPERYNCDNSYSWLQIHWQVMITMTGSLVLVLLCSACCCQCCKICSDRARLQNHRISFIPGSTNPAETIITDAEGNQVTTPEAVGGADGVAIQMFDPESPFAFTPPDYNSLSNDEPPKYNEVFGVDGGNMNPCYIPDSPPPPFTETAQAQTVPLPVQSTASPDHGKPPDIGEPQNAVTNPNCDTPNNDEQSAAAHIRAHEFVDIDLTTEGDNMDDASDEVPQLLPPAGFQDEVAPGNTTGQLLADRAEDQ